MTAEPALSGILADIADVAGTAAALQVAAAKGGHEVYIPYPHKLTDSHWLVEAVGPDAARKIAQRWGGGGRIKITMGPAGSRAKTWIAIQRGLAEGKSAAAIASLAGVDLRTVWRHKSGENGKPLPDPNQLELFDVPAKAR